MTPQQIASSVKTAGEWIAQGKLHQAAMLCATIIRCHPRNAETLHLLGLIAFSKGEKNKAVNFRERAVRNAPREAIFTTRWEPFLARSIKARLQPTLLETC